MVTRNLISDEMLKSLDNITDKGTTDQCLCGIPLRYVHLLIIVIRFLTEVHSNRVRIAKVVVSVSSLYCSFYKYKKESAIESTFTFRGISESGVSAVGFDTLFSVLGSTIAATDQLSGAYRMVSTCRNYTDNTDCTQDFCGTDLLSDLAQRIVLVFQRALVVVGHRLVLCGGDLTKLADATLLTAKPKEACDPQAHSLESSGCATLLRSPVGIHEGRQDDASIGSHMIYTMDSDGYEHPVLTSATPSVVETIDTIFHTIVQVWCSQ